eukprot:Skav203635  [mRNA]  locus=scaffold1120:117282:125609:+ [translate_table: standard]
MGAGQLGSWTSPVEFPVRFTAPELKCQLPATLGPIRDESQRLSDALLEETRLRQLQDQRRAPGTQRSECAPQLLQEEKLLQDEVHAFNALLDEEKFDREQQLMSSLATRLKSICCYERWADASQQQVAKSQYQLEKEVRELTKDIRAEHQTHSKNRVEAQHAIVDSIASFIHKQRGVERLEGIWWYREQLERDADVDYTELDGERTPAAEKSILLNNLPDPCEALWESPRNVHGHGTIMS